MNNLSFGKDSLKGVKGVEKDASKEIAVSPVVEQTVESISPLDRIGELLLAFQEITREQKKLLDGINMLYSAYPTNPLSTVISSVEATILKLNVVLKDIEVEKERITIKK